MDETHPAPIATVQPDEREVLIVGTLTDKIVAEIKAAAYGVEARIQPRD